MKKLLVILAVLLFSCEKVEIKPTATTKYNYKKVAISEISKLDYYVLIDNEKRIITTDYDFIANIGDSLVIKYNKSIVLIDN